MIDTPGPVECLVEVLNQRSRHFTRRVEDPTNVPIIFSTSRSVCHSGVVPVETGKRSGEYTSGDESTPETRSSSYPSTLERVQVDVKPIVLCVKLF